MAATPPDRIDFVDKDQARGGFLALLKHVPDAGSTHADKHLHKIGAADAVERHVRLTGDRLGEEGFTRSRRSHHQDALGNPSTEFLKLLRVAQELHDLTYLVLGFLDSGHIGKGHLVLVLGQNAGLALAKAKGRLPRHPDLLPEEEVHNENEEHERQRAGQRLPHGVIDHLLAHVRESVCRQHLLQIPLKLEIHGHLEAGQPLGIGSHALAQGLRRLELSGQPTHIGRRLDIEGDLFDPSFLKISLKLRKSQIPRGGGRLVLVSVKSQK